MCGVIFVAIVLYLLHFWFGWFPVVGIGLLLIVSWFGANCGRRP